ncbi:MAG: sulfatase-like hydrolase/transferase [Myxococcota bacterium]
MHDAAAIHEGKAPLQGRGRLHRVAVAGLLAALACDGSPAPTAPDELSASDARETARNPNYRNLLWITVDTLRTDAVGAYGADPSPTPTLDRLAREGVVFEQVTTSSPSTLPSHASMLTGLHPFGHGVRANSGYQLAASHTTLAEALQGAGHVTQAEIAILVMERRKGLAQGFTGYRDPNASDVAHKQRHAAGARSGHTVDERDADDIARHAVRFLEARRDDPFFLWLHFYDPHAPYDAPPRFAAKFPGVPYHAEVAFTDAAVGRVIATLESQGLRDTTLVMVTSDHGEGLGDHGEPTHSLLVYDTTMRVPLVLWGPPSLPAGRRVRELVRTIDLPATALAWAELESPAAGRGAPLQPFFTDTEPVAPGRLGYGESQEAHTAFGASRLWTLRDGTWKYIHKTSPELYDLKKDPGELENLAAAHPETREELRERLEALVGAAPVADADATVGLDPEEAARLAALGYVAEPAPAPAQSLDPVGPDPNGVLADFEQLGIAYRTLETDRDYARAEALYAELGERYPNGLPVLRGWIDALRLQGRNGELLPLVDRAIALAPEDAALRLKRVEAREATGDLVGAAEDARVAHAANPCGEYEIAYVSRVLRATRAFAAQREALAESVERCDHDAARNEYAYFLATCPVDELRDATRALRLAQQVTRNPGGARPEYLDTLAAAHAELGEFDAAIRIQRQVVTQLRGRGLPPDVLAVFADHLTRYEAGQPARDPATP